MASDIRAITYKGGAAVTTSDTADDPNGPFAAFYVGATGGNVTVVAVDGSTLLLAGTVVGTIYPIAIRRVKVSGTNATSILGLKATSGEL